MPAAPLPEGTQLDSYRIARVISRGGFSIVYLALDPAGAQFAIKEYLPSAYADRAPGMLLPVVARGDLPLFRLGLRFFFEEARILSTIRHPNVIRVRNFFRANETVYSVMEFESGRSLQEQVLRNRDLGSTEVLSERFIRRVFDRIMDGLREVHVNRLLHLDIKPANLYMRMNGDPILLDFGAARQTLQRDPSANVPMYTRGFAPPELYLRDAELGPWTDIYSVGACMYSCMAGVSPQDAQERLAGDQMPERMRRLGGHYSREMIALVERCMRLNSMDRLQSVPQVQRALRDVPEVPTISPWDRYSAQVRGVKERIERWAKENEITIF
jgi:serine/threonine protein kinase